MLAQFKLTPRLVWCGAWLALWAALGVSCASWPEGTEISLPSIPGASYIGDAQCAMCHQERVAHFAGATHEGIDFGDGQPFDVHCEACHGPGSLHLASGGVGNIVHPGDDPASCFHCHLEKEAQAHLPYAHAFVNGRVRCVDCHDPHVGETVLATAHGESPESQTCYQCHQAQAGPFVFAHEAMREGCTLCHEPHGSMNAKMLRIRDNNLCLQCHITEASPDGRIGGTAHARLGYLPTGSCWTTGCHEAVHGSHVNPNLRF